MSWVADDNSYKLLDEFKEIIEGINTIKIRNVANWMLVAGTTLINIKKSNKCITIGIYLITTSGLVLLGSVIKDSYDNGLLCAAKYFIRNKFRN